MIFTFAPEPRTNPAAKELVAKFKAAGYDPEGYTLYTYASIQMYVAAATATKGSDSKAIMGWLRAGNVVKTVLGDLALDAKGDVKDAKYVWYKFANGNYAEDPTIQ
jgi:branched-chain amino acid transport system substrate-binding protein